MTHDHDIATKARIEEQLIDLLWNHLKRDPEHKDRRRTGYGTKTMGGLAACIRRIVAGEGAE